VKNVWGKKEGSQRRIWMAKTGMKIHGRDDERKRRGKDYSVGCQDVRKIGSQFFRVGRKGEESSRAGSGRGPDWAGLRLRFV